MEKFANVIAAAILAIGGVGAAYVFRQPATAPTPVAPVVSSLRPLVDGESAAKLSAFYAAFADVVAAGGCQSLGDFREAQKSAVAYCKKAGQMPDLGVVNAPIEQRTKAAVGGLDDVTLDAGKRAALAAELKAISADFGG